MELVDGVYVGEEQGHQVCRHGILLDHCTAEPLREEFRVTEGAHPRESMAIRHGALTPESCEDSSNQCYSVLLADHQIFTT